MHLHHDHKSAATVLDRPLLRQEPDNGHAALRPMVENDIESVAALIGHAMNPDEGEQALKTFRSHFSCKEHAVDDGRSYYVLTEGTSINGVVGLHHYLWGPPENVWLAWFAVRPDRRAQGLGAALLSTITHKAKQLGYMKLFIETYSTPEFARARAFYKAKGFTQAGHVAAYLPDGGDMVVFSKDLTHHV